MSDYIYKTDWKKETITKYYESDFPILIEENITQLHTLQTQKLIGEVYKKEVKVGGIVSMVIIKCELIYFIYIKDMMSFIMNGYGY